VEANLFLILFWSGPIGLGIFLVCIGGMIYLIARADEISKRVRHEYKEEKK
jgi:hypothetical protein